MLEIFTKIRVLPILIFAATMLLTVKIGDIYHGVDGVLNGSLEVTGARAQQGADSAADDPRTPADAAVGGDSGKDAGVAGDAGFGDESFADDGVDPQKVMADDPTLLTRAEIDLLQQLAQRRDALDARERELDEREGLLEAAESRIGTQFREMRVLEGTIKKLIQTHDEQRRAKINSLVKLYENMKPKDAAKIFEDLEMETLLAVVKGMKERKLAQVMAKMNPERARAVTIELMQLGQLPDPGSRPSG